MTREPIYAAVFAYFSALTVGGSPAFITATRKVKTWEDVAKEDQPALLMLPRRETALRKTGLPTIWTLDIDLLLYVATNAEIDKSVIPGQVMNPLLDALEAAIPVDDVMNGKCTLGGLVSHCAINGPIELFPGSLGDEAVAIVPLQILTSP